MDQREIIYTKAIELAEATGSKRLFLFLDTERSFNWFVKRGRSDTGHVVLVLPTALGHRERELKAMGLTAIVSWAGSQSRFSRIKYAFLQGVLKGYITPDSKVTCLLGPYGKDHLDTLTVHDLASSWTEEFPFDPREIIAKKSFRVVMAVVDIALDIGSLGREGKSVGTTFLIGDSRAVLASSHQAVFNPFKGYPQDERDITRGEVVESIKELAQLDGAFVITGTGIVEAAGRHLESPALEGKRYHGLGSRHRAAAGITNKTKAVAVVVSESTGRVTIFNDGAVIATLEPTINKRLV